jgi:formate transporter
MDLLRNWALVYAGNFAGSVAVAYFLVYLPEFVDDDPWSRCVEHYFLNSLWSVGSGIPLFLVMRCCRTSTCLCCSFVIGLAEKKIGTSWGVLFLRGVGCNMLVCLAIVLAVAAKDVTGTRSTAW